METAYEVTEKINGQDLSGYIEFLRAKMSIAEDAGIIVSPDEVHKALQHHQRDAVVWACAGGRRALFESFGLGKTIQQIEIIRLILKYKGAARRAQIRDCGWVDH